MAYGNVSTPWIVSYRRLTRTARPKEGSTFVVAASDSNNTDRADYVCDGTADEVEINQALNALPTTGGYVHLLEGTYNIDASIVIPVDNVSLIGAGRGTEILATITNMVIISATNISNIFIANLYLHGIATALSVNDYNGIHFTGVTDSTVSSCWIERVATDGIALDGSTDNEITGNNLQNNYRDGIMLDDVSTYNRIAENHCQSNTLGITLGTDSPHNNIIGNVCRNSTQDGITTFSDDTNIVGNICSDNSYTGIWSAGSYTNITGNTCNDNTLEGIYISIGNYNTITGNIVQDNARTGIWVDGTDNNTITGNVCEGTTTNDGILLGTADDNVISSNRCTGNGRYGINVSNATCDDNLVVGNHLMGNTTGALNDAGTATKKAANLVASCSLVGSLMPVIEEFAGATCTGASGATGRTLTLANTLLSANEQVTLDGLTLRSGAANHYTIAHNAAASVITFNVAVDDDNNITCRYYT